MTTRAQAERVLFLGLKTQKSKSDLTLTSAGKLTANLPQPKRRRVNPMYCPDCASWVDVYLEPVRLCCTGCGAEATL